MKKLLTFAAMTALSLPGSAAFAAHPYVGFQGGIVKVNNGDGIKTYLNTLKTHYNDVQNYGARIFTGVRMNSALSIEGGYSVLPESIYFGEGLKNVKIKLEGYVFDAVVKGRFPITPSIKLYGLAGLALVQNRLQVSDNGNSESKGVRELHYKIGVGADYEVTNRISVGLEYTCTPGQIIDISPALFNIGEASAKQLGTTPDVDMLMLTVKFNL